MIDVTLRDVCVEVLAFDEPQEELIYNLNVWPSDFQNRLVFLRIECFALGSQRWGDGTKQVLGKHLYHPRVHGLCDDGPVVGNIV
jgi:hypothetical protein